MNAESEYQASRNVVMPFGKYVGRTFDQIAQTDEGLKYLDWARGEFNGWLAMEIDRYLSQDAIARDLDSLLDGE